METSKDSITKAKVDVDALVDILLTTESASKTMHHSRTSGTPIFWMQALGEKNNDGPLTDEDIEKIVEAKMDDPASADEVFPNLFLGNKAAAEDVKYMKEKGITHLLNMGCSSLRSSKFLVCPDAHALASMNIELKNSPEWGNMKVNECFEECGAWIDERLSKSGKVLVVCWQGASRSASIVLAYLMKFQKLEIKEALIKVKQIRDVRPNNFFLQQLIDYQNVI